MALYVRELSDEEKAVLENTLGKNTRDAKAWKRARIILLSSKGSQVPLVAPRVGIHPMNVRKWIHRFNAEGIEGLKSRKSPGRPKVFSDEQREQIVTLGKANPKWTLAKLKRYLVEQGIVKSISVESVRQILKDS